MGCGDKSQHHEVLRSISGNRKRAQTACLAKVSSESGVTTIEYALIAALIFLVVVVAVREIGVEVAVPYETIGQELGN